MGVWKVAKDLLGVENQWASAPRQPRGVPTGLAGLDTLTKGLRPREVTLLAARTSHGKSALALTIAVNALKWELVRSLREGREPGRVLYLSPEMHPTQLLMRLASAESRVDLEAIEEGTALPEQRQRWRQALEALEPLDPYLIIEGGRGYDIEEVESVIRSCHAERRLVLVVIDYIQRINYGVVDDEYRGLSLISQNLKDLANEIAVPFLVVSQLNRQIEKDRHQRERMPDLSDLRGSGRLEEDADNVWLLWRPPRYSQESAVTPQSATLLVAKARSGKPGVVNLWFYPRTVSFVDDGAGKVRADGGLSLYAVAGEPLPSLLELSSRLTGKPVPASGAHDEAAWTVSGQAVPEGVEAESADPDSEAAEDRDLEILDRAVAQLRGAFRTGATEGASWDEHTGTEDVPANWLLNWGNETARDQPRDIGAQRGRSPPRGRRRGADFEKRLVKLVGGYRWPGLDGDIETPEGWRLECKYRAGLRLDSTMELREWIEQVTRYSRAWPPEKKWAIAITGGRSFQRGQVFILLSLETWLELLRPG